MIYIDKRENRSGIPTSLKNLNVPVVMKLLKSGDYDINHKLLVERKTKDDFVQSLINKTLFKQCKKLKSCGLAALLILEGNPYKTPHRMKQDAIRGALLSITVCWQIPVFCTRSKQDTTQLLIQLTGLTICTKPGYMVKKHVTENTNDQQHHFLQGLPQVGPQIAHRLIEKFHTVRSVVEADLYQLTEIDGIGYKKAKRIHDFINREYYPSKSK